MRPASVLLASDLDPIEERLLRAGFDANLARRFPSLQRFLAELELFELIGGSRQLRAVLTALSEHSPWEFSRSQPSDAALLTRWACATLRLTSSGPQLLAQLRHVSEFTPQTAPLIDTVARLSWVPPELLGEVVLRLAIMRGNHPGLLPPWHACPHPTLLAWRLLTRFKRPGASLLDSTELLLLTQQLSEWGAHELGLLHQLYPSFTGSLPELLRAVSAALAE